MEDLLWGRVVRYKNTGRPLYVHSRPLRYVGSEGLHRLVSRPEDLSIRWLCLESDLEPSKPEPTPPRYIALVPGDTLWIMGERDKYLTVKLREDSTLELVNWVDPVHLPQGHTLGGACWPGDPAAP